MTANTPPPATGRDHTHRSDEPCSVNCPANVTDGPHLTQPPAPQAGASVEALASTHWHWDEDDLGAFGCGYLERGEQCPLPEHLYVLTPAELAQRDAAVRAEAWDEGHAVGYRKHADDTLAGRGIDVGPVVPNPYRIARTTGGDR